MHNRMLRHYAFAYIAAKGDKAKEREAVKECPKEWRELVRLHVKLIQEKDAMREAK
jgi:hypothetical protein